jgi:CTP synthase (UTP-ammonia lyase)
MKPNMQHTLRIALVGDYSPSVTAHVAIPKALALGARETDCEVEYAWIGTIDLDEGIETQLQPFDAVWCVPASPYASMEGALGAIRYARETRQPFLGTCGGYQHAVLEYARNVLGHSQAALAEVDPDAPMPLIAPLSCAMVERDGEIRLRPGTRIREIYAADGIIETYHCSYGFNREYESLFAHSEMISSAVNSRNEPQAIELTSHPFFLGTAFQPERAALNGKSHPLVEEFLRAVQTAAHKASGADLKS